MFYDMCIDWWYNKFAMENKFHKCPGCDKNEMENLNNIMLPCQLRRLYRGTKKRLKKSNEFCVEKVSIKWKLCVQNNDKFCVEKVSINWQYCVSKKSLYIVSWISVKIKLISMYQNILI